MSESSAADPLDTPSEPPRVISLRARLAELDQIEVDAHPETYQRIHAELQDALAGIDDT